MSIDVKRRRAVMRRSRQLGHCVCDVQQSCPCQALIDRNICHCAGERPERHAGPVALTKLVRRTGCSSKIGQADLLRIVKNLPVSDDPNVLLGAPAGDDAGVYRLPDGSALVQTVDVFSPCVDDPYLFGQIAAANSLSDIYAMGGQPLTALSVIGFPIDELDGSIMEAILLGGTDKLHEAGCSLLGGHSINDPEIKCGFAVTGLMPAENVIARDKAQPGDVLVLTKPVGTGLVSFAASLGRAPESALNEVGASMATLNRDAAELLAAHDAHACTDITGFGLAGHLVAMVRGSDVDAEIDLSAVPVFACAAECLKQNLIPGALDRNQAYSETAVYADGAEDQAALSILYDPQTSGGLLVALPASRADAYVEALHAHGHTATAIVGRIVEKATEQPRLLTKNVEIKKLIGTREPLTMSNPTNDKRTSHEAACEEDTNHSACCEGVLAVDAPVSPPASDGALGLFKDFMREANQPGLIDKRAKKLMAVALAIATRCHPCAVIHIKAALGMGITRAEIDEAAGLAIAFGGCSAMMLYKEVWEEVARS